MSSSLIDDMIEKYAWPVLGEYDFDLYVNTAGDSVVFFSEDPKRYPESNDVAMILPELVKAFEGRLQAAVVEPRARHTLQSRFGFTSWPSLVFLREGRYLGAITGVRNWRDYLHEINELLAGEPVQPPGFGLPVVNNSVGGCH